MAAVQTLQLLPIHNLPIANGILHYASKLCSQKWAVGGLRSKSAYYPDVYKRQDEGITTSNAMSTFMIQTSDGKEIGFIKDNCPSDENALTSDSGDSVIVTYVTSDNANFPLEIRKGK